MSAVIDHALLRDSIAALADGELSAEEQRFIEEHLRGCAACRQELIVQRSIRSALACEPARAASADLRRRIERIGAQAPPRGRSNFLRAAAAAAALVLLGIGVRATLHGRPQAGRQAEAAPVVRDALADCRRVMGRQFPRKADLQGVARDLPFSVRAIDSPQTELFSTWKTTLAGAPAAGLAYRWRGSVVVQYAVPAELIQQLPGIGEAVRSGGRYAGSDGAQTVVAFVANGCGGLLVGDASAEELLRLVL